MTTLKQLTACIAKEEGRLRFEYNFQVSFAGGVSENPYPGGHPLFHIMHFYDCVADSNLKTFRTCPRRRSAASVTRDSPMSWTSSPWCHRALAACAGSDGKRKRSAFTRPAMRRNRVSKAPERRCLARCAEGVGAAPCCSLAASDIEERAGDEGSLGAC